LLWAFSISLIKVIKPDNMFISKIRVQDFKSHYDTGEIELSQGINIITGQNNSGKTALLQAISLSFGNSPHKSSKTLPDAISTIKGISNIEVEFSISREDLMKYIYEHGKQLIVPAFKESDNPRILNGAGFIRDRVRDSNQLFATIQAGAVQYANISTLEPSRHDQNWVFNIAPSNKLLEYSTSTNAENTFVQIARLLKNRIYYFKAERLKIGSSSFGKEHILRSDASNLPEVLNVLQGDLNRFTRYNESVVSH
jgi:hypothetical protein